MAVLWIVWYATTIIASFVWLAGGVAGARLSLGECTAGAIAVGTIGGAWAIYFAAIVTGSLTPLSVCFGTAIMVAAAALRYKKAAREIGRMFSSGQLLSLAAAAAAAHSPRTPPSATSGNGSGERRVRNFDNDKEKPQTADWVTYFTGVARSLPLQTPDYALIFLELILGLWLWPLYSSRMIPEAYGSIYSGGSCYGDLRC